MTSAPRTRVLTGLKPTGRLQIGNYLGAIRPLLDLAADPGTDVIACVADLHALTVEHDPARLRAASREVAATLLACGLDPRARLFLQSSVPAHTALSYLLESTATYGEMTRMVQFKEKSAGTTSIRLSLLTYPALMAADVLVHRADVVPVGEDQRQHLELTTTLARRFNARYGDVLTVPRGVTPPDVPRLKDLRDPTTKMGKTGSDGSGVVFLLDDPDTVAAKVRRVVTDADPSLALDAATRPGVTNLATLLGALNGSTPQEAVAGLRGSGGLKAAVTEALVATLRPVQRRYAEITADPGEVDRVLRAGRDAVEPEATATVGAVAEAMGLVPVG
ncbi:tryptophan--tRNA ligase [Cellulomonas triticagri]|uniref:Tryptophan--tRNA ligase n=1 Tax=Cellulomonas triticagri TaxID=2483352 RepID=A0A3M2JQQ8_9CELL|nr:tryptophan--tRNA ligase [Cellulomonas triticagri]RMI12548.1 tryptophan--tRNA ligase [Cellulomonas triticagri]